MMPEIQATRPFLDRLQQRGRSSFTTEELADGLGRSSVAARAVIRRLRESGQIASPLRGFHALVPPEYRRLGSLPAEQFVPDLMAHLGEPYYAALLTAAAYHGASHHAPQVFQVMLGQRRRDIECGAVRVQFLSRADMKATTVEQRNTARGFLRVATAAATSLELVGYVDRSGGLDNVATVLSELAEAIDPQELRTEIERSPVAWAQRLGYLAELVGAAELASLVEGALDGRECFWVDLDSSVGGSGAPGASRWKVSVNTRVEADL